MRRMMQPCWAAGVALLEALAACDNPKGTLDRSQVEYMTVEGRRFEVRMAPADVPGEYRVLAVRATIVVDPDPAAERARDWAVAKAVMDRTCKNGPYTVLEHRLADNVNFYTRFRCGA
jgi:hypothetical protein